MIKSPDLGLYILNDKGNPQKTSDFQEWGEWFQTANRSVAETLIGPVRISTVFLAMDHNVHSMLSDKKYNPVLYETMIFGGELDGEQWRWHTKSEALAGHEKIVEDLTGTSHD